MSALSSIVPFTAQQSSAFSAEPAQGQANKSEPSATQAVVSFSPALMLLDLDPATRAIEKLTKFEERWLSNTRRASVSEQEEIFSLAKEVAHSKVNLNDSGLALRFIVLCGYIAAHDICDTPGKMRQQLGDSVYRSLKSCLDLIRNGGKIEFPEDLNIKSFVWALSNLKANSTLFKFCYNERLDLSKAAQQRVLDNYTSLCRKEGPDRSETGKVLASIGKLCKSRDYRKVMAGLSLASELAANRPSESLRLGTRIISGLLFLAARQNFNNDSAAVFEKAAPKCRDILTRACVLRGFGGYQELAATIECTLKSLSIGKLYGNSGHKALDLSEVPSLMRDFCNAICQDVYSRRWGQRVPFGRAIYELLGLFLDLSRTRPYLEKVRDELAKLLRFNGNK